MRFCMFWGCGSGSNGSGSKFCLFSWYKCLRSSHERPFHAQNRAFLEDYSFYVIYGVFLKISTHMSHIFIHNYTYLRCIIYLCICQASSKDPTKGHGRRPPPLWRLEIYINMHRYTLNMHTYV